MCSKKTMKNLKKMRTCERNDTDGHRGFFMIYSQKISVKKQS